MAETIREIIKEKSEALRHPDQLGPHAVADELVELSSLLASLNTYLSDKLYWLNVKKAEAYAREEKAARAKIVAEASPEWKEWHDAEMQKQALLELMRSLKYFLKNAENESRESRF